MFFASSEEEKEMMVVEVKEAEDGGHDGENESATRSNRQIGCGVLLF